MDMVTPIQSSGPSLDTQGASTKSDEAMKTPVRPGRGSKRKLQSPTTPSTAGGKTEDGGGSVKKRRKSTSGTALSRGGSPGTSLLKPMTERQQMALLLQLTDPSNQTPTSSPAASHSAVVDTPPSTHPTPETTPKSRGVQRKNERGETPLHIAAIKGDLKAVMSLLRQGANVRATDHAGWTPLHEACNYGHSAVAKELLDHNADVNAVGMDGDTPMHDAVGNGHLETVRVLLEHGGTPHCANEKGLTPIDICTHPNILVLLKSNQFKEEASQENDPSRDDSVSKASNVESVENERVPEASEETPLSSHKKSKEKEEVDRTDKDEHKPVFSPKETIQEPGSNEFQPSVSLKGEEEKSANTLSRGVSFSDISSSENEMEQGDEQDRDTIFVDEERVSDPVSRNDSVGETSKERAGEHDKADVSCDVTKEEDGDGSFPLQSSDHPKEAVTRKSPECPSVSDTIKHEEEGKNEEEMSKSESDQILASSKPPSTAPPIPRMSPKGDDTQTSTDRPDSITGDDKTLFSSDQMVSSVKRKQLLSLSGLSSVQLASGRVLRSAMKSPEPGVLEKVLKGKLLVSIPLSLVSLSLAERVLRRREGRSRAGSEQTEDLHSSRSSTDLTESMDRSGESYDWRMRAPEKMTTADSKESSPQGFFSHDSSIGDESKLSAQQDSRRYSSGSLDSCVSGGEPRDGVGGVERHHSKHSRKPQVVFSSKKLYKETRSDSDKTQEEGGDVSESFSISVDWSNLKSPTNTTSSVLVTHGPIRKQSDNIDDYIRTSGDPTLSAGLKDEENDNDNKEIISTNPKVMSFSMSLPLAFSSQRDTTITSVASQFRLSKPTSRSMSPDDMKVVSSSSLALSAPTVTSKRESTSSLGGRDVCSQLAEFDGIPLPPKKRHRPVARSAVLQQRLSHRTPLVSWPANISSFFLTSSRYRSKEQLLPVSPKIVYPPLPASMYKQFIEQESERVRLATAHLVEQDRLILSMEQEVLRAQQRATKGHPPISACSVLLEKLLPPAPPPDTPGLKLDMQFSPSSKPRETEDPFDSRLLCGLVQDVWDKFNSLKFSLLARQRHEAESLWLAQREQWVNRKRELGVLPPSLSALPTAHVPLVCLKSS